MFIYRFHGLDDLFKAIQLHVTVQLVSVISIYLITPATAVQRAFERSIIVFTSLNPIKRFYL